MKTFTKFFAFVAVAVTALVSCAKEVKTSKEAEVVHITVKPTVEAFANDATIKPASKTYIDGTQTILWGTGEYMKIAVAPGTPTKDNAKFATSSNESADSFNGQPTAEFDFSVSGLEESSSYTYMGIYPASAASTSSNNDATSYKVNLPTTQNATASSYDPAAYIMVAKPKVENATVSEWLATFRRATALNKITLKNVPSGVSIKRVKITAEGKKLAGGRHFDLTTGEGSDIYGNEATIEVHYETPLSGTNVDVWFTSWNVEIAESEKLTIVAYTTDKKSYTKEITVPSGKTIKFQEGYLNTLGANLSGITPANVTEFEAGDYVVLAKSNSDYFALKAEKESGKERLLSVAYTGSLESYNGDANLIWTISKSGDSFIFENDSKYLGYKGSNNESYWLEADENWTESNYLLDVTPQETAGQYYVTVHSNSSRHLSKNSNDPFFAFYGNTGQKADIVFVPATVDARTAVTLSFAEESLGYDTSDYGSCTGQAATASPSVNAITSNISYAVTSDEDDVISSLNASSGDVTLTGNTGTATVTASFAGDEDYRPATASYTISVSTITGPQYTLVSAVADVVAGQYVITWDNAYYLPNTASSKNPVAGSGITVSGSRLSNTVTETMVWTFTGNNNDGFSITAGENRLHSTNAAQGIYVNTTSTVKWTASVDETHGMMLHGDEGGARFLAVLNNSGTHTWRYYTNGNDYVGTLRLYKLDDSSVTPTVATPTLSISGSEVSIACATEGATIYYTVDGSTPSTSSSVYSEAISLVGSQQKTIKAFATKSNYDNSEVADETYYAINRAATTNGSIAANDFAVEGDEVTITVTPDSGYTLGTLSVVDGSNNAVSVSNNKFTMPAIPVTVSATFDLIPVTTISTILSDNTVTSSNTVNYSVSGVTVMAAQGDKNYVIGDATGVMLMYYNSSLTVGNQYDVEGAVKLYNGVHEFNNPTVTAGTGTAPAYGTPETMTVSSLTSYAQSPVTKYAIVSLTAPASGYVGSDGTNNINVYDGTGTWASYYGKSIVATGYLIGFYNSKISFLATSIEEDTTTPTLSVDHTSLNWAASETDSKSIVVTLNASAAVGDYSYSVTSGTAGDWNIAKNNGTITVSPKAANTSTENAKSITIRVVHAASNTVYQDVTCTQAKVDNPDFTPFNVWEDDFSNCSGTSSISSLSGSKTGFSSSYSGISTTYYMTGAIRVGKASGAGTITTPVLSTISGTSASLTVTFDAAGWNGKTAKITLSVNKGSVTEGQTTIASESTMAGQTPSMTGTSYTFHVTGADNTTKITFTTTNSIGIDNLVIRQTAN